MKPLDITGQRYGRLVGIHRIENQGHHSRWLFQCDCGAQHASILDPVRRGKTVSCGCYAASASAKRNATHGHTRGGTVSKAFGVWRSMKARCRNPNTASYPDYGGRGITVCERWDDFANFLADMGEPPEGAQIDRQDNALGYSPENCRWVSRRESVANRRNTVWTKVAGSPVTVSRAAEVLGVNYSTLLRRVRLGEDAEPAAAAIHAEVRRRQISRASRV